MYLFLLILEEIKTFVWVHKSTVGPGSMPPDRREKEALQRWVSRLPHQCLPTTTGLLKICKTDVLSILPSLKQFY